MEIVALGAVLLIVHFLLARSDRRSLEGNYPSSNYSVIEDGLYLGALLVEPPFGTKAVLNLCETEDRYQAEVHRWEPLPDDGPAPAVEWLLAQVAFIENQRNAGRAVFVHCRAGQNRSATVVVAYLMRRDGLTRDEALAFTRRKRPCVRPHAAYMEYLAAWEAFLKRNPLTPSA